MGVQKMVLDSKNFTLYKLILNSLTLDNFEYCYLCPLLEQTGLYSAQTDVILTAQKLSQQAQNIFDLKILFQNYLQDTHECINKEYHIHFFIQLKMFNLETHFMSYENMLIAYYMQHLFSGIYLFQPYYFFFQRKII